MSYETYRETLSLTNCEATANRLTPFRIAYTENDLMEKLLLNREPLLTTAAVSRWLGVAPRTVCLWAECREIPAMKIGRQWRFREAELREWLRSAKTGNDFRNEITSQAASA